MFICKRKSITALMLITAIIFLSPCTGQGEGSGVAPVSAAVVEVEKYGHALLDITASDFEEAGFDLGDMVLVCTKDYQLQMPYFSGYYTDPGQLMLRGMNPGEGIALCINYGNFAQEYNLVVGDTVQIAMAEKAAMAAQQESFMLNYTLTYTNDRADYSDDQVFANFRAVRAGRIAPGKLYRSASPVKNTYGRAAYANDLIAAAGVAAVLNLSDSAQEIEKQFSAEDFDSAYYAALYEAGQVMALNLGMDYRSQAFAESIARGLTFLSQNDGPYGIHCEAGKDRAGYVCILLEALMGADLEEITQDYMISFYNYYGITQENEPERYQIILEKNLLPMMYHLTGAEDLTALARVDLEEAAAAYLLGAGMAQKDIEALQEKLS